MKDERKTKAQLIGELAELRKITELHQTAAVQPSSQLATNMREAAYVVRAQDGVIAYTNPAFARMFGYGEDEMVGRHASMVNAPTDKSPEETAAEILADLERDGVWSGGVDNIKKDGTRFRCSAKVCSFDHAEHGKSFLAVHADITEQRETQGALWESQERFRALVTNTEQIVFIIAKDGTFVLSEGRGLARLGLKPGEVVGESVYELYEDHPEMLDTLQRAFHGETTEMEVTVADNHFRTWYSPHRDRDGEITGLLGLSVNITEQVSAESALRERVKEIRCLHDVSEAIRVANDPDELLASLAQLIPPGWQYPEITCARITVDDREFVTSPFKETRWRQSAEIVIAGRKRGTIEVLYLEKRPELEEGPFLRQERELLDSLANAIASGLERLGADEAVRRSERRYRLLAETAQDHIYVVSDGLFTYVNGAGARFLGKAVDEVLGQPLDRLLPPEVFAQQRATIERVLETGEPINTLQLFALPRGDRWIDYTIVDLSEQVGPATVMGMARDVTDKFIAQQRHEAIIRTSLDGFWFLDPEGRFRDVNQAYLGMSGYSRDEFLTLSIPDLEVIESPEETQAHIDKILSDGSDQFETRHRRKDGSVWDVEVSVSLLPTGGGGMVVFFRDITERKRAERERALTNRIRAIFLSASDDEMYAEVLQVMLDVSESEFGVFGYIDEGGALVVPTMTRGVWDECQVPEKKVVFSRETWGESIWPRAVRQKELLFSNRPSELLPKGHIQITRNITAPMVHQGEVVGLLQVANKPTDYNPEDIALIKLLCDTVAPILSSRLERDAQEKQRRVREQELVTLNQDLDARVVQRTADLSAVNKELEAFAYSVAHDLRAPLRGIDGFSQALLEEYTDKLDDTGRDYLDRVRDGAQRMGRLIDDLLELSRLSRADLRRQKLDLSKLAGKIVDDLQRGDPERQTEFEICPGATALGDRTLVDTLLGNLLGNSWKFTGRQENARIEFGVTVRTGEHVYHVRDNGAGFDMAYVDRLFGPFQRLHSASDYPGTGIGLAIAHRVVNRHGGRIWAEGEVDKGAAFYFTLPTVTTTSNDNPLGSRR